MQIVKRTETTCECCKSKEVKTETTYKCDNCKAILPIVGYITAMMLGAMRLDEHRYVHLCNAACLLEYIRDGGWRTKYRKHGMNYYGSDTDTFSIMLKKKDLSHLQKYLGDIDLE